MCVTQVAVDKTVDDDDDMNLSPPQLARSGRLSPCSPQREDDNSCCCSVRFIHSLSPTC